MPPPTPHPTAARPIRILMLHGYAQSGPLFRAKTRALEKALDKAFKPRGGVHLVYANAPNRLSEADIPRWDLQGSVPNAGTGTNGLGQRDDEARPTGPGAGSGSASASGTARGRIQSDDDGLDAWGWWKRDGASEPYVYTNLDACWTRVAAVLRDAGPFDGVIGFSQGAGLAGVVASLLEDGRVEAFARYADDVARGDGRWSKHVPWPREREAWRDLRFAPLAYPAQFLVEGSAQQRIHPPFKFAVSYSGFAATHPMFGACYSPAITTPFLHVIGSVDTVVSEARSLALVQACEGARSSVVTHPGGHFVPASQKPYVAALVGFIEGVLREEEKADGGKEEERAEDMDLPF